MQDDTESRIKRWSLTELAKRAKDSPWVLVLLAFGGGKGTEEVLGRLAQISIEWWWVAIGIAGLSLMNWMRDVSATLTKILERLSKGDERFERYDREIAELKAAHQSRTRGTGSR